MVGRYEVGGGGGGGSQRLLFSQPNYSYGCFVVGVVEGLKNCFGVYSCS